MPLPLLFIAVAAATGLVGVGKSVKAAVDTREANKTNKKANDIVNYAKNNLENARKKCGNDLNILGKTKVRILDTSINKFIKSFEKLKNVNFKDSKGLNEMEKLCIDSKDFKELKELGGFATSIAGGFASGAIGGALTAFGAYSAAGAFAAASTGTAIASLSGAAATNATLAFFGGGSLAAGGLGIAGGTMVLGGLVAGPALAIMGFIVGAKASAAKDQAYTNLAKAKQISEELGAASDMCHAISEKCYLFINLLNRLDNYFKPLIIKLEEAISQNGIDYSLFNQEQKQATAAAASLAKAIKVTLDTPILDKDGNITLESSEIFNKIKPDDIIKETTMQNHSQKYKKTTIKELCLDEIINLCKSNITEKMVYSNYYLEYAIINWDRLITHINSSYGIDCTTEEYKSHINLFGKDSHICVNELTFELGNFIKTYQISIIIESCLINYSSILKEEDVDWNKLIHKISVIYDITIEKWQLFHPGVNKPEDVLKRICEKISCSNDYNKKLYFTTSEFNSLMSK